MANNSKDNRDIALLGLDTSSDAYALLQFIKNILNSQTSQQNKNSMSMTEQVKNVLEKISKENEDYLIMNKARRK
jgi:hypothetical protein